MKKPPYERAKLVSRHKYTSEVSTETATDFRLSYCANTAGWLLAIGVLSESLWGWRECLQMVNYFVMTRDILYLNTEGKIVLIRVYSEHAHANTETHMCWINKRGSAAYLTCKNGNSNKAIQYVVKIMLRGKITLALTNETGDNVWRKHYVSVTTHKHDRLKRI